MDKSASKYLSSMPNRLIHEQTTYLLQHAHNPVDWYPWGDEAFEKSRREHKPVIVSIGYAACHWCHVMERESFEDTATAQYMNEHFVCVKVDREELPDVDAYFMDAVQAISGSGGWPLNAFATADRVPFYGGTYFPPRPSFNRPSWMQVLQRMHEIWTSQAAEVAAQSSQMVQYLRQVSSVPTHAASMPTKEDCRAMATTLLRSADPDWGGFGAAPKFPNTDALTFLLEHYIYVRDEAALEHCLHSLDRMIAGGIYDQIGGGFCRYSTDRQWLAPHFEKMLYDNALLVSLLCDAYQVTKRPRYKEIIEETVAFVNRELKDPSGGFYCALDADSEGVEGKFYTWTWQQWQEATGGNEVGRVYFGVEAGGNWEGTNILHCAKEIEVLAKERNMPPEDVVAQMAGVKKKLIKKRSQRPRPVTDDKCILSWNALMNLALTKASQVLDSADLLRQAEQHLIWMQTSFGPDAAAMKRVWKAGTARISANLDDYVFLAQAMLQYGVTAGVNEWILEAGKVCESVQNKFGEKGLAYLYFSERDQQGIPVRKVELMDGVQPSGNAVMAGLFINLGMVLEHAEWIARGEEMIAKMARETCLQPLGFGRWGVLMQRSVAGPKTVVISGRDALANWKEMRGGCAPHVVVLKAENADENLPLTAGKGSGADSLIFVCTTEGCMPPVVSPKDAFRLL